jgi:hypothetical protein
MEKVLRRSERGWAGHFILSDRCLFRRNTLLEYGDIKIVVSTVGNMVDIHAEGYPNIIKIAKIGSGHYYETKVFHCDSKDSWYNDIDVNGEIDFGCNGILYDMGKDVEANEMHELVVEEIIIGLKSSIRYGKE